MKYVIISTEFVEHEINSQLYGVFDTKEEAIKKVAECKESLLELLPCIEFCDDLEDYYYAFDESDGYINEVKTYCIE